MSPVLAEFPRVARGWMLDQVDGLDDVAILLHPTEARWAVANGAGVRMAGLMDGTRSLEEVATIVAEQFGAADVAEVLADLTDFVGQLRRSGLLEDAPEQAASPAFVPTLVVYLTEQCNLRCRHCAIVEGQVPQTQLDAAGVMRLIGDHTAMHPGAKVTFLGGEPMLHPDCLDLLEFACQRTGNVVLATNGLLITEEVAAWLAGRPSINVQISLDGADATDHDAIRGKGTFDRTMRAMERLAAAGAGGQVSISTTLTKSMVQKLLHMLARMDAMGVGRIKFLPLVKQRAALTNWDEVTPTEQDLAEAVWWLNFHAGERPGAVTHVVAGFPGYVPKPPKGRHWCPLGQTFIVDSQGKTFVCPSLTSAEVTVGNALVEGMERVERDGKAQAAREWMEGRRHRVEECRRCHWRNFCQGGCLAFMGHLSGSPDRNDGYCELRRNLYRRNAVGQAGIDWKPGDLLRGPLTLTPPQEQISE